MISIKKPKKRRGNVKLTSNTFFLVLLVAAFVLGFFLLASYIPIIALAFITAAIFRPMHIWVLKRVKGASWAANIISISAIFLIVIVPVSLVLSLTALEVAEIQSDLRERLDTGSFNLETTVAEINNRLESAGLGDEQVTVEQVEAGIRDATERVGQVAVEVLFRTGSSLIGVITQVLIFIAVLAIGLNRFDDILVDLKRLSPLPEDQTDTYLRRMVAMSTSMVKGIIIVGVVQGIIAAIVLAIAGVDYVFFWGVLSVIASIIPLGTGLITLPIAAVLIATGNVLSGVFVIVMQVFFISLVDNIIRPKLASKEAELDETLTLLGILGGLQLFGFFGIIFGPLIMIFLATTIELYQKFYRRG